MKSIQKLKEGCYKIFIYKKYKTLDDGTRSDKPLKLNCCVGFLCPECKVRIDERKKTLKELLKILQKIRKILNRYHSQIPQVEVGRQNVLNDIDNEVKLDETIEKIKEELK